jgi:hypothetical protein
MLQINRVSKHRFTLTDSSYIIGEINLHVFSEGRAGRPDEMIATNSATTITKSLNFEKVMLLYCLFQTKTPLTVEEWELILPEHRDTIVAKYQ